jgi:uncharacterized coiled-coil DUF342 family protein
MLGAALLVSVTGLSFGQTQPGGRPGFDPAAIRERIMQAVKTAVNPTDDEWKVLEPKLVKVMLLRMDVGEGIPISGSRGVRIRAFIRNMLDPNSPPSQVDERLAELQKMIDDNETSNDFYHNKVEQLRKAREKAREELKAAQEDVTKLLTLRQEAALVDLGILD